MSDLDYQVKINFGHSFRIGGKKGIQHNQRKCISSKCTTFKTKFKTKFNTKFARVTRIKDNSSILNKFHFSSFVLKKPKEHQKKPKGTKEINLTNSMSCM